MTRIVDLSPTVTDGFRGPPSTDVGARLEVRTKPGYWQSSEASLSVHTGCHVESELHVVEGGRAIDALPLERALGTPDYFRLSPALSEEGAEWLVSREPRCVGCDFFEEPAARDPGWEAPQFVVHRTILGAGVPLVEGLVGLGELPPRCEFFAPFSKLGGIEAAPARAFAMVPEAAS